MSARRVVVVGGGAAGFFAAIACAETDPSADALVLEKSAQYLSKVRISGGGRCNVTHACFDPRELSRCYPRGGPELVGPFHTFQPSDTMAWFEDRGVKLKIEADGRVFPVSDSSQTIIECLLAAAKKANVRCLTSCGVERVTLNTQGQFELILSTGEMLTCEHLMLATGGCRVAAAGQLATSLGHSLIEPVPSLFTFQIGAPWLRKLAGISLDSIEISLPGLKRREQGPALITHAGLSGPAILRLSAWGARDLHRVNYQFPVRINWLPRLHAEALETELQLRRATQPARFIVNTSFPSLPARLWEQLVLVSGIPPQTRWAELSRSAQHRLIQQLLGTELQVAGKSLNKDEFVTCGGVPLKEVNLKTMESRICHGLFFGGELLDVDGLTGGFNFQAAWTTGWIAGHSMSTD